MGALPPETCLSFSETLTRLLAAERVRIFLFGPKGPGLFPRYWYFRLTFLTLHTTFDAFLPLWTFLLTPLFWVPPHSACQHFIALPLPFPCHLRVFFSETGSRRSKRGSFLFSRLCIRPIPSFLGRWLLFFFFFRFFLRCSEDGLQLPASATPLSPPAPGYFFSGFFKGGPFLFLAGHFFPESLRHLCFLFIPVCLRPWVFFCCHVVAAPSL